MRRAPAEFARGLAALGRGRVLTARRRFAAAAAAAGPDAAAAAQELVQTFLRRGETERAEPFLREHLPAGSPLLAYALGSLYRRSGRAAAAIPLLEKALAGPPPVRAAASELGYLLCRAGSPRRGLALLASAEKHFARLGDDWGHASALALRATYALTRHRLDAALPLLARTVRAKRKTGDRPGLASALHNLGGVQFVLGRYADALDSVEQAIAALGPGAWGADAGRMRNTLGLCLLDLAEPERASAALRDAIRIARRAGDEAAVAASYGNLGYAARMLGKHGVAVRHYRRALSLIGPGAEPDAHGTGIANLAQALAAAGRPRDALELIAGATVELARLNPRTRFLLAMEEMRAHLALGETRRPIALGAAALGGLDAVSSRAARLTTEVIEARTLLGRAYLRAGDVIAARRTLRRAVAEAERQLGARGGAAIRIGLLETARLSHETLVEALLAAPRGSIVRAWALAARLKARELRPAARPIDAPPTAAIRDLALNPRPSPRGRQRLLTLRREYLAAVERADRYGAPNPSARVALDPRRTHTLLGRDAALLEYHVGRERSHVFVVHRRRIDAIAIDLDSATLAAEVERLCAPLVAAGSSSDPRPHLAAYDPPLGARLGAALLAPALALLAPSVRRLVIVPDGVLHSLPFELLSAGDAEVLERYDVTYARSSTHLRRARGRPVGRFLGLGFSPPRAIVLDAGGRTLSLGPLPGARAEVDAVAALFPRPAVLAGPRADAARFCAAAGAADVVHVAAHAVADTRVPELSALVVAPEGRARAGADLLYAARIERLRLGASLVTLSACESGAGRVRASEGAFGLARSFLRAGASAVLASLWRVDDRATRDLMVSFYRHLLAGHGRGRALAAAKRELRARGGRGGYLAHPYFWAAFVLIDHRPRAGTSVSTRITRRKP